MSKLFGNEEIVKVAGKAKFHVKIPGKIDDREEQSALP